MLTSTAFKKYTFYLLHLFFIGIITSVYLIGRSPKTLTNPEPDVLGVYNTYTKSSDSEFLINNQSFENFNSNELLNKNFETSGISATSLSGSSNIDLSINSSELSPTLPNTAIFTETNLEILLLGVGSVLLFDSLLIFQARWKTKIEPNWPRQNTLLLT